MADFSDKHLEEVFALVQAPESIIVNKEEQKAHKDIRLKKSQSTEITEYVFNYLKRIIEPKLSENEVFLDFEEYEFKNHNEMRYICGVMPLISQKLGYGNLLEETTKFGKQTFTYNESKGEYKKSWREKGIGRINKLRAEGKISEKKYYYDCQDLVNQDQIVWEHLSNRFDSLSNKKINKLFQQVKVNAITEYCITHGITMSEKKIQNFKIDWKKNEEIKKIVKYIYEKNHVYGISQKYDSEILWVDIDKDPTNEKFYTFLKLFNNPKILYAEKSKYSQGWHIYLKFDKSIPNRIRPLIEKYCEEYGNTKIECCFYNNFLQMVCSVDYSPLNIEHFEETGEMKFFNQLTKKGLFYTCYLFMNRYKNPEYTLDSRMVNDLDIGNNPWNYKQTIEEEVSQQPIQEEEQLQEDNKKDYSYITESKAFYYSLKKKTLKATSARQFQEAEAGNKNSALINNTFACCERNIYDCNEVREILEKYQGTSTTIADTSDNDIKRIQGYYNKDHDEITYQKKNQKPIEFVSNQHLIPESLSKVIDKVIYDYQELFYQNAKKYYKDKDNSKKQDLKIICKHLAKEFIGKCIYNYQNPTKVIFAKKSFHDYFKKADLTNFTLTTTFTDLLLQDLEENKLITHHFKSRTINDIFVKTFSLKPTFIYDNMNPDKYNCNKKAPFFTNGLPIQYDLGNIQSESDLINNISDIISVYSNKHSKSIEFNSKTEYNPPLLNIIYVDSNFEEIVNNKQQFNQNEVMNAPPD